MPHNPDKTAKREAAARAHINAVYGTPGDEYGVTLFVSHHLNEIEASYWLAYVGTAKPEPRQVLDLLEPKPSLDDEEDDPAILDFTLPGDVTNYVICVEFDEAGNVAGVAMES
ncbi:MAG: DUF2004 domain-containing protein [Pseudomonadota bacterium]